ncbi:hypothetical protein DAEQUDRAFT_764825 [Daedalea quercina L-15889]|uniref:DUF6533 domain-containing protein n=1 Tax=Daedalea quercina L-15889 TaxID=1314783 RepID=A0A165QXV7_9APHY|nr:hypothetical protein DAEQUDRAFT_764825 [Daedalea quercina L-15889]
MERAILLGSIADYCVVAATVLYLYDGLLTFSDSVELIWCRKITAASILYILNRYLMLPWLVLQLMSLAEKDCEPEVQRLIYPPCLGLMSIGYRRAYIILQVANGIMCSLFIVFAALSAIRVYSLNFYGFDWKLPTLVTSLVLFQFGTSIYTYSRYSPVVLPVPLYCATRSLVPAGIDYRCVIWLLHAAALMGDSVIAVRVLNIMHDALILFFTWLKTRGRLREYGHAFYMRNSLMTRLLLNGAIYFIVHLALNILDAVLTVTGTFDDTIVFNSIFTPLILSHFFLSIRRAHHTREEQPSTPSQLSNLSFDHHTQPREARDTLAEDKEPEWGAMPHEVAEDNDEDGGGQAIAPHERC